MKKIWDTLLVVCLAPIFLYGQDVGVEKFFKQALTENPQLKKESGAFNQLNMVFTRQLHLVDPANNADVPAARNYLVEGRDSLKGGYAAMLIKPSPSGDAINLSQSVFTDTGYVQLGMPFSLRAKVGGVHFLLITKGFVGDTLKIAGGPWALNVVDLDYNTPPDFLGFWQIPRNYVESRVDTFILGQKNNFVCLVYDKQADDFYLRYKIFQGSNVVYQTPVKKFPGNQYYVSTDMTHILSNLGEGDYRLVQQVWDAPTSSIVSREYNFAVRQPPKLPRLAVDVAWPEHEIHAGDIINLTVRVKNIGQSVARNVSVGVEVDYLSLEIDQLVPWTKDCPEEGKLWKGTIKTLTIPWTATAGEHIITVYARIGNSAFGGHSITRHINVAEQDGATLNNYPNPGNPNTTIEFRIPRPGQTSLKVFNINGQLVKILLNGYKKPGVYKTVFAGQHYSSGIYICRLEQEGKILNQKMMLIVK